MSAAHDRRPTSGTVPFRLVPTRAEREAGVRHARFLAESLFTFGRQVREFADRYVAPYHGREDQDGVAMSARFRPQLRALAARFEKLAAMAFDTASLPVNRERLDAELDAVRGRVAELAG